MVDHRRPPRRSRRPRRPRGSPRSRRGGALAALLLAAAASGCGGVDGRAPTVVRDSAGVTIVENGATDVPLSLTPVHVADLIPPDSALTAVPWGVAADPMTGRIYAADWNGTRVVVFDGGGEYVGSYGREGDGPGELRNPVAVAIDPYGALAVWDAGRAVLSRWSSEGDLLNEQRAPVDFWGPGFAIGRDRIVTVTSTTAGTTMEQRLVAHGAGGTETLHELPMEMGMMRLPGISMPAPKVFAPSIVWTSRGDTLYVLHGPEYRIDRYAGGATTASVRRALAPTRATEAMAVAATASGVGPFSGFMRQSGLTAEQLVRAVGFEETFSPVIALAADPAGRLWATRSADGVTPDRIDVFEPGGEYAGTLEAPGVPAAFVSDSTFLVVRLTDLGEPVLSLYALRGASDGEPADGSPLPSGLREFRDCPECPVMVELPPGRFRMGNPGGEAPASADPTRPPWTEAAEGPAVEVEIAYALAIGKYEVTFAEWDRCVEAGGCSHRPDDEGWGRGDRPVINVSRSDAEEYVAWLRERTGEAYRLPSEAEWEYAARGGTTTARYWGDEIGSGMAVCDGCGSRWDDRSTAPVGSFPPNPFGLHDVLGNAVEWVADCWVSTHEGNPGDGSARIEASPYWKDGACERPVRRGGAWSFFPWTARAATRTYFHPGPWDDRSDSYGLRVARTVAPAKPG